MAEANLNLSIENDQLTLYKVSLEGDAHALETLLQADELVLQRPTLTSFNETPLHIAAMCGHLHFAQAILSRKPKQAEELDSLRRLPLHLASAEGHVEIVKELLRIRPNYACLAPDEDGRIPLHLAAMKGRNEVIKELIRICPGSIREKVENGETILHLCVKYNQLEALKVLVEIVEDDDEFVNASDDYGNTILHLASVLKQLQITKYLLSDTSMKTKANALNMNGFTALDAAEHTPRDSKSLEIQIILLEAGIQRNKTLNNLNNLQSPPQSSVAAALRRCFTTKFWKAYYKNVGRRLEEMRGNILVAATVTATLSYQAGINPPGQASGQGKISNTEASADIHFGKKFFIYNTVSLMLSLFIILALFSGIPFGNKLSSFLFSIILWFILLCISEAYACAAVLNFASDMNSTDWTVLGAFADVVSYFCRFILFLHAVSFLIFVVWKMWKSTRQLIMSCLSH